MQRRRKRSRKLRRNRSRSPSAGGQGQAPRGLVPRRGAHRSAGHVEPHPGAHGKQTARAARHPSPMGLSLRRRRRRSRDTLCGSRTNT
jgi:hypothetical protein